MFVHKTRPSLGLSQCRKLDTERFDGGIMGFKYNGLVTENWTTFFGVYIFIAKFPVIFLIILFEYCTNKSYYKRGATIAVGQNMDLYFY